MAGVEADRAFASAPADGSPASAAGFSKSNNAVATDAPLRDFVSENTGDSPEPCDATKLRQGPELSRIPPGPQ
jgi:hypothetical protein